ncbi:hypothetical protein [Wolbachia endosymbiont of Litomosoides sigmodontis]|uniref:hypothetical protein n=1 Tax=Wolbachia endosymbiont of Litomosoides sigmodontis TaxID=80850 RepID=UPI001C555AF8|nr:hypothetical protein [Wolbachia endosymbiont of Litomosoides sigmodontis]
MKKSRKMLQSQQKKHGINSSSKNMLHFKNSTNCINKAHKIWKRKKLLTPP